MPAPLRQSPAPAGPRLVIDLGELPPEGAEVAGELPVEVFDLEPGAPRPLSPLRYRLHLQREEDRLTATGEVSADFSFECVRCLEPFTDRITLDGYFLEEELEGKTQSVDLTDRVREDILLTLPGHPRCEEASLNPHVCSASKLFLKSSEYSPDHPEETSTRSENQDIWGALDQLDRQAPAPPSGKSRRNR